MVEVPDPVTKPLVTSMVSTTELSKVFFMMISPVSTLTVSLKVSTRLAVPDTPVALSAGEKVETVGERFPAPAVSVTVLSVMTVVEPVLA